MKIYTAKPLSPPRCATASYSNSCGKDSGDRIFNSSNIVPVIETVEILLSSFYVEHEGTF